MTDQIDMFGTDAARARSTDPDTSHEAAADVTPNLRKLQADVLAFAAERGAGGFIDPDLAEYFGSQSSTYRTRRSELVDMGLVHDTGQRRRIGDAGSRHAVWRITDRGRVENSRLMFAGLDRAA